MSCDDDLDVSLAQRPSGVEPKTARAPVVAVPAPRGVRQRSDSAALVPKKVTRSESGHHARKATDANVERGVLAPTCPALIAAARRSTSDRDHDAAHVCITVLGGGRTLGRAQAAIVRDRLRRLGCCAGEHPLSARDRAIVVSGFGTAAAARDAVRDAWRTVQQHLEVRRDYVPNVDDSVAAWLQHYVHQCVFVVPQWAFASCEQQRPQPCAPHELADARQGQLQSSSALPATPAPTPDDMGTASTGFTAERSSVPPLWQTAETARSASGPRAASSERRRDPSFNAGYMPVFFDDAGGAAPSTRGVPDHNFDDDGDDTSSPTGRGLGAGGHAAAWKPFGGNAPVDKAQSPFLSEQQQRTAAYIDHRKPFACQQPPAEGLPPSDGEEAARLTGAKHCANAELVAELVRLKDVYRASGDKWREYAYNKAAAQLSKLPTKISSASEISHFRGIGAKILNKIDEILATGTTRKLQHLSASPEIAALQELTKIWGVGPAGARKLYGLGYKSVAELRAAGAAAEAELSAAQLVGLRHFEDLQERIPRREVAAIEEVLCAALRRLRFVTVRPDCDEQALPTGGSTTSVAAPATGRRVMEVMTCGSYRRGKETSGDVDVLLCDRSGRHDEGVMRLLLDDLKRTTAVGESFAQMEHLTFGMRSSSDAQHCDTWFGVVRLPPCNDTADCPCCHKLDGSHLARRLDIKLYPAVHYPFAVLYFTGSDYFNRSMRLYAQKHGMSLSDKELRHVVRVAGDKVHEGTSVSCNTERDIFDALGLPYRTPQQRDIS